MSQISFEQQSWFYYYQVNIYLNHSLIQKMHTSFMGLIILNDAILSISLHWNGEEGSRRIREISPLFP